MRLRTLERAVGRVSKGGKRIYNENGNADRRKRGKAQLQKKWWLADSQRKTLLVKGHGDSPAHPLFAQFAFLVRPADSTRWVGLPALCAARLANKIPTGDKFVQATEQEQPAAPP